MLGEVFSTINAFDVRYKAVPCASFLFKYQKEVIYALKHSCFHVNMVLGSEKNLKFYVTKSQAINQKYVLIKLNAEGFS
jgi:hypothetical protein